MGIPPMSYASNPAQIAALNPFHRDSRQSYLSKTQVPRKGERAARPFVRKGGQSTTR